MFPILSDLESLARQAGEILKAGYAQRPTMQGNLQIRYKGAIDPVTEFDHRSEEFLVGEIRRRFPQHSLVAEESGEHAGDACCVWYIDPLDGTVNYAHGVPIFAVTIAYAEGGRVNLGVVYDPLRDECFSAERGKGAFLNGLPIRATSASDLDRSLLVTGFSYDLRTTSRNNLDHYARFALISQGVRRLGSAALDLCYIASGRLDGYWELSLQPWDLAAGTLIAAEAGATVTAVDGDPDVMHPPYSVLAANAPLHAQMLAEFKSLEKIKEIPA
jgi:myo-inositol-1(or 4)-monophosphatase